MGFRRAAFLAGKKPKMTPTAAEKRKAITTMPGLKMKGIFNSLVSPTEPDRASRMPIEKIVKMVVSAEKEWESKK